MNWITLFNNIFKPAFIVIFMIVILGACGNSGNQNQSPTNSNNILEKLLLNANKDAVKTEDQQIRDFISRHNWKMAETGTGLRYRIYKKGNGALAAEGYIAEINYEVSLLNGEILYSSKALGNKEFRIGRGGVESGLEEAILLMHEGDRAKFIIPSHLAYGLSGDENKITGKATLVYDVELLKLK